MRHGAGRCEFTDGIGRGDGPGGGQFGDVVDATGQVELCGGAGGDVDFVANSADLNQQDRRQHHHPDIVGGIALGHFEQAIADHLGGLDDLDQRHAEGSQHRRDLGFVVGVRWRKRRRDVIAKRRPQPSRLIREFHSALIVSQCRQATKPGAAGIQQRPAVGEASLDFSGHFTDANIGSEMGIGCPPYTGASAQFIDRLTPPDSLTSSSLCGIPGSRNGFGGFRIVGQRHRVVEPDAPVVEPGDGLCHTGRKRRTPGARCRPER